MLHFLTRKMYSLCIREVIYNIMKKSFAINLPETLATHCSFFSRLSKNGVSKNSNTTLAALEAKVPYMLCFLGNEDDDVSSAVIDFATEYIATIKTMPSMSEVQKKHIEVGLTSNEDEENIYIYGIHAAEYILQKFSEHTDKNLGSGIRPAANVSEAATEKRIELWIFSL